MHHQSQLRICHQPIGDDPADFPPSWKDNRHRRKHPLVYPCDQPAYAWCFDCEFYVCDIHQIARHDLHRTQLVSEEDAHDNDNA